MIATGHATRITTAAEPGRGTGHPASPITTVGQETGTGTGTAADATMTIQI